MKLFYKGAGIAIFTKNEDGEYSILLGKRKYNPGKGKWSIPGGGYEVKKDKNLFITAVRETMEETGIDMNLIAKDLKPIVCKFHFVFFTWDTYMYDLGNFSLPEFRIREFSELRSIPLSELKNFNLCFGIKTEVRKFLLKK